MPEIAVDKNGSGLRLDRFLKKALPGMPTGHIFKLLRKRKVRVNGKRAKAEQKLVVGDMVLIHMPEDQFSKDAEKKAVSRSTRLDFTTVFEDAHLLVVAKPPFLAVHPGAGHATDSLIDQVHTFLEVPDGPSLFRPSLAHRLDRDTSGLLIIGKDADTLRALSAAFKDGRVSKKYLALCAGQPKPPKGTWEMQVQRRDLPGSKPSGKQKRGRPDKPGVTGYRVAKTGRLSLGRKKTTVSLLVLKLLTGRTHQIRSHLVQAGHPLAGDRRYGDKLFNRDLQEHFGLRRQFLHAYRLSFTHPQTGKLFNLSAPYPDDLMPIVRELKLGVPAY